MAMVKVPIDKIDRIEMIEYKGGCTPKKIQQLYGADIFINGVLFDNKTRKIITNTKTLNTGKQGYLFSESGMGVKNGRPIWINKWDALKDDAVTGFIGSAPTLIVDGKINIDKKDITDSFYGTTTYRSGIGFNNKELILYSGGERRNFSNYAKFAESLGLDYFLNVDGGGSCCLWKDGKQLNKEYDGRLIPMWILIWIKKDNKKEEYMKKQQSITVIDGDIKRTLDTQSILDEGTTYLPIRKLGEAIGYTVNYDSSTGVITLVKKSNESVVIKKESVIAIDTGHSIQIPGASGFGLKEEEVCFKIGRKLGSKLQQKGYMVKYVRNDMNAIGDNNSEDLNKRCGIINASKCDLVVSIHNNAYNDLNSNGIETLVYSENSKNSVRIGKSIQSEMIKTSGLRDRGIKYRSDLAILKRTTMDAVLLEIGFITNKKENELLRNDGWLDKIVDAITIGIEKEVK